MSQAQPFQEPRIQEYSIVARSPSQTQRVTALLALHSSPGDVLLLAGGLGAGKTTFVQGFAHQLGVVGPITSPTFTLLRQYPCNGVSGIDQLLHADVYRLQTLSEVLDLALSELLEQESVAVVEWGDALAPLFGQDAMMVRIERTAKHRVLQAELESGHGCATLQDNDFRRITLVANGPIWNERMPDIISELDLLDFDV